MNRREMYAGVVWLFSAVTLTLCAALPMTSQSVPGIEQVVDYIATIDGMYVFAAAFLSILIEGIYVIGSFFPGTTLVLVFAILSQTSGVPTFLLTILAVYIGWCLAGVINILAAKLYGEQILKRFPDATYTVNDRPLTTWFPAFRANYEVAQIVEGAAPLRVFWSSIRVKTIASIVAMVATAIIPLFIDINEVSNGEGALSIFAVAVICYIVGYIKLRSYLQSKQTAKLQMLREDVESFSE